MCVLILSVCRISCVFFFKQKTAYEMRISDWSSDVCSSDLPMFPLIFAIVAIGIAIANFSNAAIVERFGARRVSQSAVFAFMATSILQIIAALSGAEHLWMFTALMMVNVGLVGFIVRTFVSIPM